jgi:hypothetical protein
MINPMGSSNQMAGQTSMPAKQQAMTADQKSQVNDILDQYSVDNLSSDDATAIVKSFEALGITPGQELEQVMADKGFDAKSVGDSAGLQGPGGKEGMPPPPKNEVSNSSEMVSFLEEILESYGEQLSDEDKDSILTAVQEKFGMDDTDSLIHLQA